MITTQSLAAIRADIDSALAAVAAKHGLSSLKTGKINYTATSFKSELLATAGSTNTDPVIAAANPKWIFELSKFRHTTGKLGKKHTLNGRTYTIAGVKPRTGGSQIILHDGVKFIASDCVFPTDSTGAVVLKNAI